MSHQMPPRPRRLKLGEELKRLRVLAGVTQRQAATATRMSQSTVFRVENGTSVPSWPEVVAWADVTRAAGPDLALLRDLTEAALNEMTPFRERLKDGLAAIQEDVRALEATAATLRNFQPTIIPGLLQTPAYAGLVLGIVGNEDPAAAVASRMRRQQILYEPGRQFEFLMTEAALTRRLGPVSILAGQLEHVAAAASAARSIELGVIPGDAVMKVIPWTGFVLYEDRADGEQPMVAIETAHAQIYVSEAADVKIYREYLALLRESALRGEEAIAAVRSLIPGG